MFKITTSLFFKPYKGLTLWPFIFVAPDADKTILPHEMVHYGRQAWWAPVWWLLYIVVPSFRLNEEVLAYRVSMQHGMPLDDAVQLLMTYHSGVDLNSAKKLLTL